jgi:hypothetical protein
VRIPSGVTDQYIYFVAVDSADLKTRETGLSSFTVYRSRNGGAAAAFTTPTINETDNTNMPGVYELLLDEDMTIDSGDDSQEMVFHITQASMAPVTRTIELYRPKITAGNTLDVTATGAAGIDWGNVENPTTALNLSGTNIDTDQVVASVTGAVGSVTGSVGSVTGAVGSVTGAVGSVTGNVGGNVTGSVGSVATGGISEASFATTAGSFAPLGVLDQGTAQSATGTTIVLRSAAGFANDELIGATVYIVSGTGAGQSRVITDYVGSTDTATVDTWTTTPSGTIVYKIFATPPASATAVPAVNLVQVAGSTTDVSALATNVAAILVDTGTTLDGKLNTIDDFLDTEIAAILADTNELQTDWANGGRLDLLLDGAASAGDPWTTTLPGAYGAGTAGYIVGTNVNATVSSRASQTSVDTIDDFLDTEVAAILADTNELQTDWANGGRLDLILDARASQTSVDTIDDFLDTEIAAIKAKTDSLTFTAANKVDANVLNVNSQDIGATKPYDTAT